jgi:hypothetical protein
MAKEQGLSLNPSNISGVCGRLMCCLKNEEEVYEFLNSKLPSVGDLVTTPDGLKGEVNSVSVLNQKVKVIVDLEKEDEKELREYKVSELRFKPKRKKCAGNCGCPNKKGIDNKKLDEQADIEALELAERQERERCDYLEELAVRQQLAEEAQATGYTVRQLIEQEGATYDEERDEMRLVAKVPGLNIYLEVLGVLDEEDTAMERWWAEHREEQPFDRAIDAAIGRQLQRMAYFMTTVHEERDRRTYATMESDWQPRQDWQEEYDPEEWWQRPERKGIGFTHTDPARRGTVHVKHTMTDDEQAELARLRTEAEDRGEPLDAIAIRRLKLKAVANVAARKMMKG